MEDTYLKNLLLKWDEKMKKDTLSYYKSQEKRKEALELYKSQEK